MADFGTDPVSFSSKYVMLKTNKKLTTRIKKSKCPKTSYPSSRKSTKDRGQISFCNQTSFFKTKVNVFCTRCNQNVQTKTETKAGAMAWIIGGVLCLIG